MSQKSSGECLTCGKRYRIPASSQERSFTCQDCGGQVVAAGAKPPPFLKRSGASQKSATPPPPPSRRSTKGLSAETMNRKRRPLVVAGALAAVVLLLVVAQMWQSGGNKTDSIGGSSELAAVPANFGLQPDSRGDNLAAKAKQKRRAVDVARSGEDAAGAPMADDDSPAVAKNSDVPVLANTDLDSSAGAATPPATLGPGGSDPIARVTDKRGGGFAFALNTPDIYGKTFDLASLRGKVVLVDLWGTWCPPCRKEIPHLVRLKTKFARQGLEIVGVNFERVTSADAAIKLVRKARGDLKINYRCVLGTDEIRNQVPEFRGYPTMLILARDGQVHSKLVGYHSYEQLEGIVNPLLADDSSR